MWAGFVAALGSLGVCQALPMSRDTDRLKKCRAVFEHDMKDVEAAIIYFSAQEVYVPI